MPCDSVVDQCPQDTLLALGDFNTSTGPDGDGYEARVDPHESGMVNHNSTEYLHFTRSRGLKVAGSWFQHKQPHRWTWYSCIGGVANDIDHVLIDCRERMLQNCGVYRSAQFLNTDHRPVGATLKLELKFRKMVPSPA